MKWIGLIPVLSVAVAGLSVQDEASTTAAQDESTRRTCRANLMTYANAAMAHRVKERQEGFSSNLSDLDALIGGRPVCPAGGAYSIEPGVPEKSFTVHCTLPKHDAGRVQPAGYSPRLNSDGDDVDFTRMWNAEVPVRGRCRARMVWISRAQIDYLLDNGNFATNLEQLHSSIGPQKCPGQGTYSIVVGKPTHAFTVHCSVKEHDAGIEEPKGYSPGLNTR